MERNLQHINLGTLKTLYNKEVEALHARLLSGASWEDTQEQRRLVTELSIAMHRRTSTISSANPAESQIRGEEGE